jgi:hypothetical protein
MFNKREWFYDFSSNNEAEPDHGLNTTLVFRLTNNILHLIPLWMFNLVGSNIICKYVFDQILIWPNTYLTKYLFDQILIWPNTVKFIIFTFNMLYCIAMQIKGILFATELYL